MPSSPPLPRPPWCRARPGHGLARRLAAGCALAWTMTAVPAGAMELVTADFPAVISPQGRDAPGPLGDFLVLLCERAGWDLQPHFYPFARATLMARTGHQVLMAPLARTPERELLYRWLVPLYTHRYALIGPRSRWPQGIDEARARSTKVLTLRGALSSDSLHKRGFRHVSQEAGYEHILRRMEEGSAGLIYGAVPVVMAALQAAGQAPQDWVVGPSYDQSEIWLVGSPDLTDREIQPLLEAFEKLRRDGEHQRLLQRMGVLQGSGGL
ncbi:transporter substrate-binding domain-containing protein [Pelomonas sp. APW6]|uniref:Transporter substrate-binding domain-containing protein n=1 Tax=Roseateles subflavus TaxID=3053353 RepID=A0ABT7LEY0_9BURK|nr:transporter substrate-binding domain-containing protein [Pelomonas sp. APW6]MDL5031029.1 transporter substrate-binding domain-containing protein [Pelomonas sp. APW6]